MFNFEKLPAPSIEKKEEKGSGLEGMCEECHGSGRVRPGFLKAEKVCGNCHGHGFVKPAKPVENESYSWDTGLKH